jgi:hypothetical protein
VKRSAARIHCTGALEIRASGAGSDHLAAREHNRLEVATLAPEGTRHGFVEKGEAVVHLSLLDQARSDRGQGAEFQIEIARPSRQLLGLARQLLAGRGIIGLGRLQEEKPSPEVFELELLDQPPRAREPAGGGSGVADVGLIVDAQPERDGCGLRRIRAAPKLGVRLLPVGDGLLRLSEPPQRLAEAVQRLCRLAKIERGSERIPRGRPISGLQRAVPRCHQGL